MIQILTILSHVILFVLASDTSAETYTVSHWIDSNEPVVRGVITSKILSSGRKIYQFDHQDSLQESNQHDPRTKHTYWISLKTSSGKILKSSAPLCFLQSSNFMDSIVLHMDGLTKEPWHIDYSVNYGVCNQTIKDLSSVTSFKTTVSSASLVEAPRPILETIVPTPDGKPVPQKSFLQQYWYLLIPLIVLLIAPADGPQQPGQGGQAAARK